MRRRWLLLLLVPIFLLGGAIFLVSQEGTLQWLAQKIVQASGGSVEIEGVSGTLVGSLEIEKVVYTSPERDIEINDLKLAWNPWPLLHGRLEVDQATAARLKVELKQSSDEPFTLPQSLAPPFDVQISEVSVDSLSVTKLGAGVTLENVRFAVTADNAAWHLNNLGFDSPFGNAEINADLGTAKPFKTNGTVRFHNEPAKADVDLTVQGDLDRLVVTGRLDGYGARGRLDAIVTPLADFPVESVQLDATGIDPSHIESTWPVARFDAKVHINAAIDRTLNGTIDINNAKPGPFDQNELPIHTLKARIGGRTDRIVLSDIVLDMGKAGQFTGEGFFSSEKSALTLETSRFDLHEINSRIRQTRVAGTVGFVEADDQQEFTVKLGENHIRLDAHVVKEAGQIALEKIVLKADRSELHLEGNLSLEAPQDFEATGKVTHFNFASFGRFPESDLNFDFDASGHLKPEWEVAFRYAFLPSRLFGQPLSGQGRFQLNSQEIRDADVLLALGGNTINASGNLGKSGDRLFWKLHAPDLGVLGEGYKGNLSGQGEMTGSLPALQVQMTLEGTDFLILDQYGARKLAVKAQFGTRLQDKMAVAVRGEDITIGSGQWKSIQAQLDGTLRSHTIKASAMNETFDLTAEASGGLSKNGEWQGKLDALENRGKQAFTLASPVPLKVGNGDFSLQNLVLQLPSGQLTILKLVKKGTRLETSGSARGVPLTYLLAISADSGKTLRSDLTFGADWSLTAGRSLDGNLHIYREKGDVTLIGDNIIKLGLKTFDMEAVLSRNTMRLTGRIDSEKAGVIQIQGMTELTMKNGRYSLTRGSPLQLSANVDVPSLAWIGPLTGQPDLELGGSLSMRVEGRGTVGDPKLSGNLIGKDLSVNWLSMGVNLSKGELLAVLEGNRIQIQKGIIYGPEGSLQLHGGIQLKNGQVLSDLQFTTDKLLILSNVDRQLAVTGQGKFSLDENRLELTGDWRVDRAMIILPDTKNVTYSKDVVVLGRPEKKKNESVPLRLDLKVDLGNQFYLKGKGLSTRLVGQIQAVSGRDNRLRVYGTINTVDGTYSAFGQKLAIKQGQVTFSGPVENPTLDILAGRDFPSTDDVTEVGVSVKGTAQSPRVKLVSTPEVSDTEKLSWLVLGYGGGENGDDQQRAAIAAAAAAILSTEQSGGFPTKLASTIGLDDIGISSSAELDETVLSLSKRISSRLYLTYEQGLTGATNLIKLRYIISRRLSLVGQTGTVTAVDLLYDWKFD